MSTARLIIDPPAEGEWNMAVDESLLESAAAGVASLRFYQWEEPTLSLGYFQNAADRAQHAASLACPLVRRTTGGGAIIHDRELTYSFAAPQMDRRNASPAALYNAFHETLAEVLASLGIQAHLYHSEPLLEIGREEPFLCFQRRAEGDVILERAKICGSAQRRHKNAILQHGSILLARSTRAPEVPGIEELAGLRITPEQLTRIWIPLLESRLELRFHEAHLDPAEVDAAHRLEAARFATAAWAQRR